MDHIDMSALQNLDDASVRMEFRPKDTSYSQKEKDGTETFFYVDSPWASVPLFSMGMDCPCNGPEKRHIVASNELCEAESYTECSHGYTVCSECIDSWATDYYFKVGLVRDGEVTEWFALNGAPGYKQL